MFMVHHVKKFRVIIFSFQKHNEMNKIPLKAKKIKIKIYVNGHFCIFIMIFFIIIRSIKEKFSI